MIRQGLLHQEITLRNISLELAIKSIGEVLGEKVKAIGYFGSLVTGTNGVYSDIDFVLITEGLQDPDERELQSPLIKANIRENGYEFLGAFNIYESSTIEKMPIWLAIVLSNNLDILHDPEGLLGKLKVKGSYGNRIENVGHGWNIGVNNGGMVNLSKELREYGRVLKNRALLLEEKFPKISHYLQLESERMTTSGSLAMDGIFCTNGSFEELSKIHNDRKLSGPESIKDQRRVTLLEEGFYGYGIDKQHEQIAEVLKNTIDYSGALIHLLTGCHSIMREILHNKGDFMVDGEVTQLFLQKNSDFIQKILGDDNSLIFALFKSEQVCGRSGGISFDLTMDGDSRYAKNDTPELFSELLEKLSKILNLLRLYRDDELSGIGEESYGITVSILINASGMNQDELSESIKNIDELIFPSSKAEIIIDRPSGVNLDVNFNSRFSITINNSTLPDIKPKGTYHWQISKGMKASRLSLFRLLARCQRKDTSMVKPNITQLENKYQSKSEHLGLLIKGAVKDLLSITNPDSIYTERKAIIYL
ncbi:nucleotidyltransferase domain-containing protein [Candidatus Gracilibacteria bacterium]|nr:nucleotidyltransferase domain-containing protein [Candidatus Gracilibacteria bacterium]